MKESKKGMTLVEVVISMAIIAVAAAASLGGISLSLNLMNRASTIRNDYNEIMSDMAENLGDGGSSTNVTVTVDGTEYTQGLKRQEFKSTDDDSPIDGFYMYLVE